MFLRTVFLLTGSLWGVSAAPSFTASVFAPQPTPVPSSKTLPPPPDLFNYTAPPYPDLPTDWNTNFTTQNLLGTRLYGWLGCGPGEIEQIKGAYKEFQTLVRQPGVMTGIDWTEQPAKEFFGPSQGKNAVSATTRNQIQYVFNFLSDVYPGNVPFISHWIKAKCSSSVETLGDPKNICGDRPTTPPNQNPQCPSGSVPSPNQDDNRVEAYSDNLYIEGGYDQITFCGKFLNSQTLDIAVKQGVSKHDIDLGNYNNRARIFLHEMTHLDYFVNAPSSVPQITDVQLLLNYNNKKVTDMAYGVMRTRILANWRSKKGGYFTQRNADSYAWYALSKYVWAQLGGKITDYPINPLAKGIKVLERPTNWNGDSLVATGSTDGDDSDPTFGVNNVTFPFQGQTVDEFEQDSHWNDIVSCPQVNPFPPSRSKVKRSWWA